MKKKTAAIILGLLIFTVTYGFSQSTVGIIPAKIISEDNKYKYLEEGVTDSVINAFLGAGYSVVERSRLDAALDELELQLSDISLSSAASVGKIIGATYVSITSVTQLGSKFTLAIRLVEASTGRVIQIGKKTGYLEEMLDLADPLLRQSKFAGAKRALTYLTFIAQHNRDFHYPKTEQQVDYSITVNTYEFDLFKYFYDHKDSLSIEQSGPFFVVFFPIYEDDFYVDIIIDERNRNTDQKSGTVMNFRTARSEPYIYFTRYEDYKYNKHITNPNGPDRVERVLRQRFVCEKMKTPSRVTGYVTNPIESTMAYLKREYNMGSVPYIVIDYEENKKIEDHAAVFEETAYEIRIKADWSSCRPGKDGNHISVRIPNESRLELVRNRATTSKVFKTKAVLDEVYQSKSDQVELNVYALAYNKKFWKGINEIWRTEKDYEVTVEYGKKTVIEISLENEKLAIRDWQE